MALKRSFSFGAIVSLHLITVYALISQTVITCIANRPIM